MCIVCAHVRSLWTFLAEGMAVEEEEEDVILDLSVNENRTGSKVRGEWMVLSL